jgi:acetylglutamate kinase
MQVQANLAGLRTAIPYIRAYKGRVFVVKFGGTLCEAGPALDNLVEQLAMLYQLGIRVVLVHGGGEQVTALSNRLGIKPEIVAGRRITNDETLEVAKMVFAGTVNTNLLAAFRKHEIPAVGLTGIDGRLITAVKRPVRPVTDPSTGETREVDFGHVGDISAVNVGLLEHLLGGGYVPVVCSLAADASGHTFNVNADTVASAIAIAIHAAKYFSVTTVDGVMNDVKDPTTLHSYLDIDELEELIRLGAISGGMLPKLAACVDALRGGVPRVHIVNGLVHDTLLCEVFTNEGCGTLIVAKREESRPTEKELAPA